MSDSRLLVRGGTSVWTTLKDPNTPDSEGPEGIYTRKGILRRGEGGLRSLWFIVLKDV